jgi:hypothetical protein
MTQVERSFPILACLLIPLIEIYDDPENFIPDRYLLTENGTKPGVDGSDLRPNFIFGVGRVSSFINFHFYS